MASAADWHAPDAGELRVSQARGRPRAARGGQEFGRARPRHGGGRRGAAAPRGGPRHPARPAVRHVPGGVRLGAAADGPDPGRLRLARHHGRGLAAARPAEELLQGRADFRRRQRDRVPAADRHPLLLHPGAGRSRLHGARGLPDGPHHGRRRPARARLHPAAVVLCLRHSRHHVDARHRRQARPAHHHPGGAADDLLGAHPGLHPDHRRLHPRPRGLGLRRPAGAGDVRPLRQRHRRRARRVVRHQAHVLARRAGRALHARTARLQAAAPQEPGDRAVDARHHLPQARRHHHPFHDGADLAAGVLPAAARRAPPSRRSPTASPP